MTKKNEINLEKTIKQLEVMVPTDMKQMAIDTVVACKDVRKYLCNLSEIIFNNISIFK